jgi:hypothetical protein
MRRRLHRRTSAPVNQARHGPTVGLADMSHAQVASVLGISRAMVGKIERAALSKLRSGLLSRGVSAEDVRALQQEWTPWE